TAMNVTSQIRMPQLTASSLGISNTYSMAPIVASCDPPPTAGNCTTPPAMEKPISRITCCRVRSGGTICWKSAGAYGYACVTSQYAHAITNQISTEIPMIWMNDAVSWIVL